MATNSSSNIATAAIGTVLQGQGIGVANAFSTATYPATSSTIGNVLTSDGTNFVSADPAKYISITEDFIGFGSSSPYTGNYGARLNLFSAVASQAGHPGIYQTLGNTTASYYTLGSASQGFILQDGGTQVDWYFNIVTLSDVTNTYTLRIGLCNSISTVDPVDGVYFEYTNATNSGNWVTINNQATSKTPFNTSQAVVTGWQKITIITNSSGTSVSFYYNNSLLRTETTTIPTNPITPIYQVARSLGTIPAGSHLLDLLKFQQVLNTSR